MDRDADAPARPLTALATGESAAPTLAVVGAGWAGIAAAVRGVEAGRRVTLYEMAKTLGGRARSVVDGSAVHDNGQHILIGAYRRTLALMATVGAPADALARLPLALRFPDGRGLALPPGPAAWAFVRGVAAARGWRNSDRCALLVAAARWAAHGFRCDATLTVDGLCRGLPRTIRADLIDPLCIAALNTPPAEASAATLLVVLRDALFAGRGSADLLLPRRPLGELLPDPAARWLRAAGAELRIGTRVTSIARDGASWRVDGGHYDAVVSGAAAWVARGLPAIGDAVVAQARDAFPTGTWPQPPQWLRTVAEKRATWRCTPALRLPSQAIAPGLVAAGDHVAGPAPLYPATLEAAVRSGESAVAALRRPPRADNAH